MEYTFQRLDESRLQDLQFLYKTAFNEKVDLKFLKGKYDTAWTGHSYVGYLAYHQTTKEPAAYYGVFPVMGSLNGDTYLIAQSGDTMTHPSHRGKGLFILLAERTYQLARDLKFEFVFGFPNQNSYPGFVKKLNWNHYANVNHYRIKTGALPFDKAGKKLGFINTWHQKSIRGNCQTTLDSRFENSLCEQMPEHGYLIHDEKFYNYKTYYSSFSLTLSGIKCHCKIDGRLWVGDISYCDKDKFLEVVHLIQVWARKNFCSLVQFSFFENSQYDLWIKEKYAVHSSIAVGCLNFSNSVKGEDFVYQAFDFDTF